LILVNKNIAAKMYHEIPKVRRSISSQRLDPSIPEKVFTVNDPGNRFDKALLDFRSVVNI